MKLSKMKGIDMFCASQAATSICHSMEHDPLSTPSSSASATLLGSAGRAIDRHNPIITDSRRNPRSLPPCTTASQPPISPRPRKLHAKNKKKEILPDENEIQPKKIDGVSGKIETQNTHGAAAIVRKSWSCTKPGGFLSPPGSTRYLLREKAIHDADPTKLSVEESSKSNGAIKTEEPSLSDSPDQVVVLRVSLHCRGCERKLRKHLSRMEGLTSFHIDFAAKKVTVAGAVTPAGVLSSICKVKNAQLWSPAISSIKITASETENDNIGAGA